MRHRLLHLMCVVVLIHAAYAQQSHWATPHDKTAKFMIDMERKWAEGVCTNNGVISELLAEDFQGTSTRGERYNKVSQKAWRVCWNYWYSTRKHSFFLRT
jgi:hypothetical protein